MTGVSKKSKVKRTSLTSVMKMLDNTRIKSEEEELDDFLSFLKKDKAKSSKKTPEKKMSVDKKSSPKKRDFTTLDKAWDAYEVSKLSSSFKNQKL